MRLSDIIRRIERIFEKKRKNPIQIEDDSNLESKLKNVKVGDINTPIQVSTDTVDIKGSLKVDGSDVITEAGDIYSLDDLSYVTYSSGDLTISSLDTIISGALTLDSSGDISLDAGGTDISLLVNGYTFGLFDGGPVSERSRMFLYEAGGASTDDYFLIQVSANGVSAITTIDAAGSTAHLTLQPDGNLLFSPVGQVDFGTTGVGWTQFPATYDATNSEVYFNGKGNKQFLLLDGGNTTNLHMQFPLFSGNHVILIKQDGTGSRLITNWLAYDSAGNAANGSSTVKFAGGSNPTLTTDANHVDIISFYWDATNEIAYGVATLDFQF